MLPSIEDFGFDAAEIERRKERIRDLYRGRRLDRVPVYIAVENPERRHSTREQFLDAEKQWEEALWVAGLTWKHVPEGDLVPAVRPDVGCSPLATAFGAELFWGDDPEQTCGVREPPLERVEDAYELEVPSAEEGLLGEGTARVALFAERGEGLVSVSLLDMAGGLNVALDLLGGEKLYAAMREAPEALEHLLGKIQELFLAAIARQIEAAGGEARVTTTDFFECWSPEGLKGHVSDDVSAAISPRDYRRFSLPSHDRVFERYGGGGLHNCGPHPSLEAYLEHRPAPRSIDVAWDYSRRDLPRMKAALRKKAFVYATGFPSRPPAALAAYRDLVDLASPDLIVVPHLTVRLADRPEELWREMRKISEDYARRIDWGWET